MSEKTKQNISVLLHAPNFVPYSQSTLAQCSMVPSCSQLMAPCSSEPCADNHHLETMPLAHVKPVLLSTGEYCIYGCHMDYMLLGNHLNVSDALGAWSHFSDNKIHKELSLPPQWLESSKWAWSLWPKLLWLHYFSTSLAIYQKRLPDSCTWGWLSTSQLFTSDQAVI